jgi:hypothetical protein
MSWEDNVKAAALAALSGRKAKANRITAEVPWIWNPREAWLTRVKQAGELAAESSLSDPMTRPRQDAAPRD